MTFFFNDRNPPSEVKRDQFCLPVGDEITPKNYQLLFADQLQMERDSSLLGRSIYFSRIMREETACLL